MDFQDYLMSINYKKMIYNTKKNTLQECGKYEILSTMGNLDFRYVKENEKTIIFGLNEHGKPPTLIYPRPIGIISDDEMHRFIRNNTNEFLYNSIK